MMFCILVSLHGLIMKTMVRNYKLSLCKGISEISDIKLSLSISD